MKTLVLVFTVCFNGTLCETHEHPVTNISYLQCLTGAQQEIPKLYPLREGQQITRFTCRID